MKINKKKVLILFGSIILVAILSAIIVIIYEKMLDSSPDIQVKLYMP